MPDELLDGLAVAQRKELWRDELTRETSPPAVYAAVDDGELVGFCAIQAPSRDDDAGDGVAEVAAIYVHPDAWRGGVGRALMDAALADLRAGGWRWVTLWVLAGNQRALDFYARFSLEPDGAEVIEARSGLREVRLRGAVTA
jgi:ribosomal protein S18 acetylase RimI-like enzyme